jgi:perosamine synthetase
MNERLSKIPDVEVPNQLEDTYHVYQLYTIRIKNGETTRDVLKDYLIDKGISCKVYFDPVHLTSFYKSKYNYKNGDLPVTEKISNEVLTLPMYPHLSEEDMDYIIENITDFFNNRVA